MPLDATSLVECATGTAQKIRCGRHQLAADQTTAAGGTDTGPTPSGLLLASLGSCTAIALRKLAVERGWELGQIRVELQHFVDAGVERIEREIRCSRRLGDLQRSALEEAAANTPVTRILGAAVQINSRFV